MNNSTSTLDAPGVKVAGLFVAAPPAAAACYPFLLKAFNASLAVPEGEITVLSLFWLLLALAVPLIGIAAFLKLGASENPSDGEILAKRVALFSVAAPTIFVFMGVFLYMTKAPLTDISLWIAVWAFVIVFALFAAVSPGERRVAPTDEVSPQLRKAHGVSAAVIVILFLAMHLANHLGGLWGKGTHASVMDAFRSIYRANIVEPLIVILFLFLIGSGVKMMWAYTRRPADTFRTLQLAAGVYLIFFILGHMNSVFIFARGLLGIETGWDFATGAPAGLIADPWNIRLIPHYFFGVFFVLTHLVIGARGVALAHGTDNRIADRFAKYGIGLSAVIAGAIMFGLAGNP